MKINTPYAQNLQAFQQRFNSITQKVSTTEAKSDFADFLTQSLAEVNQLHKAKDKAIEAFATGENKDIQSLMIAIQRASTATQLTTAVRNKILEMYRELSQLPM